MDDPPHPALPGHHRAGIPLCECKAELKRALTTAKVQRLVSAVNKSLAETGEEILIACQVCSDEGVEGRARAFLAAPPVSVTLCANALRKPEDVEESLIHELVHAYDYCVDKADLSDCNLLACSEVRAARESECLNGFFPFRWMRNYCVKKAAARSTEMLCPNLGRKCVRDVFDKCMADTRPLGHMQAPQ